MIPFIDWTFFFHSWKLNGKYPTIFEDPIKGNDAKKLFEDAQQMLSLIIKKKMLRAKGFLPFIRQIREKMIVVLYKDETRKDELIKLCFSEIKL